EPEEGVFDYKEIEHYRNVLQALKNRELTPFVTIWHFTVPTWFAEKGAFEKKENVKYFVRYAEFVVSNLQDLCHNWATINEPIVYAHNGYFRGQWPPFYKRKTFLFLKVFKNL